MSLFFSEANQGDLFPGAWRFWRLCKDGIKEGRLLYERHYSCRRYKDGRERKLFVGPGEKMVLLSEDNGALFVWRKFIDDSGQKGVNCAVFRNESGMLSSELIKEAVEMARERWPRERFYTYVNPRKIKSANPGCCFKKAGWRRAGLSKGGLIVLEYPCGEDNGKERLLEKEARA